MAESSSQPDTSTIEGPPVANGRGKRSRRELLGSTYILLDMETPNVRRHRHEMLDAPDRAFMALNTANTKILEAATAMGVAVTANGEAIQAALVANRAAIAVLNAWEDDHRM